MSGHVKVRSGHVSTGQVRPVQVEIRSRSGEVTAGPGEVS